ncbi:hypothetical protein KAFR_0G01700 [Kazachstania africana CBS 2517]|uniref:Exocyst complex component EXO84 n=1 Tax=Kazachstania africana (strain ATCC 22294 / BCRC 22015 / CBS 2517 / CECT 1963 / NBRC 1671 / NRRL Y-8276) TaxID=1071382 RepID=H2AXV4_KAZAF|nr:hypothetical protein KAFR_0G01700 [Kazachstania africana CBS 2517]CCF59204.1 hypothetical protein KAFR_0G01700 [Kazachstania africana CBS 2517]
MTGSPTKLKVASTQPKLAPTSSSSSVNANSNKKSSSDSKHKGAKLKPSKNPYSNLNMSNTSESSYAQLPKINPSEKNKAATSMHRRLSIHNQNYVPPTLDYSMPLPTMDLSLDTNKNNTEQNIENLISKNISTASFNATEETNISEILQPSTLRNILLDPKFSAKKFVRQELSSATAIEIDDFTNILSSLNDNINTEIKDNLNRSYNEILKVNNDLFIASSELNQLRDNVKELSNVMSNFDVIAEKRLLFEERKEEANGLLPPMNSKEEKRDQSSLVVLDKIWNEELLDLVKKVDGVKNIIFDNNNQRKNLNRHFILESSDWFELNVTTFRFSQMIKFFILSDLIFIVSKNNKNNRFILSQCLDVKTVIVNKDPYSNRLFFKTNESIANSNPDVSTSLLFETRDERECGRVLESIRKAKDDLCDIFEVEKQNKQKLEESFKILQTTQPTPIRDQNSITSPIKNNINRHSLDNTPIFNSELSPRKSYTKNSTFNHEQHFLQDLTLSIQSASGNHELSPLARRLKDLNDSIEEVDIQIARVNFEEAVLLLTSIESKLNEYFAANQSISKNESMFYNLILLNLNQKRESIRLKLSRSVLVNKTEISQVIHNIKTMIKLGFAEESLDIFLQNRSNLIQNLILQIGSIDNSINYVAELAIIRFQTLKQTVTNFNELYSNGDNKISSILVSWCNDQVDKHFQLIDKHLLNDEMLSPESIKTTRKQIDDLKSVGLDFVYKLDEFIKRNAHRIR